MTGTVADASIRQGALQLTISDLSGDLAKPAVVDTFSGGGGVEGGDDAAGRVKRRSWGRVVNIEGRLIDKANNVYEFGDPARSLQAFDMLKDKGRAGDMTVLAWQGSIASTFQALQSATCPDGGGVVAPSIAMAKWWTVPAGPLTADLRGETAGGYVETPTDIVSRIISARSTISPALTLAASRNYPAGIHVDDAAETVANVLDRLLLPVSLTWALSPAGTITITEWTWTGSTETLVSQEVERETVYNPLSTRKVGFQKNHRQQSDAEISSVLLLATDATYADGTPIEVLKPAQAGADVTSGNTAAAITGQGPGATAAGTAVLNSNVTIGADGKLVGAGGGQVSYSGLGGGALGLLGNLFFGNNLLLESNGGAVATLNAFKTVLGTASAITGQGALATLSSLANGSSYLTGFGSLSSLASLALGGAYLFRADGTTRLSDATVVTSQGTASAIAGQGSLATLSSLANGSSYLTGFGALSSLASLALGGSYLFRADGTTRLSDATVVTSQGTAASIAGQGAFATLSSVANGSSYLTGFGALSSQASLSLGSAYLFRSDGTTKLSDATVITSQGIAASISGQGSLATLSSLANGSSYLTGFGALSGLASLALGGNYLFQADGATKLSDATVLTAQGTASAIAGQGVLATKSSVTYTGGTSGGITGLPYGVAAFDGNGRLLSERMVYEGVGTVQSLRPAEAGSNVTENRTAAAITGQGPGATAAAVSVLNDYAVSGENTVVNSNFARGSYGFAVQGNALPVLMNMPGYFGIRDVAYVYRSGAFAANATYDISSPLGLWCGLSSGNPRNMLSVRPGEVLGVRALAAAHRNDATLWVLFYDKDNRMFYGNAVGGASYQGGQGGDIFGVMQQKITAPANAVRAEWMMRMTGNGGSDAYLYFCEVWFGKLASLNSQIPAYSPGPPDYLADKTGDNTAGGIVGQGVLATFNSVAFNSSRIVRADGSTQVNESLVVTSIGIASAITGQGSLATKNQAGAGDVAIGATYAAGGPAPTSRNFTTALTTVATQRQTISNNASPVLITVAGFITISPGSPTGTYASVTVAAGQSVFMNAQRVTSARGTQVPFSFPILVPNGLGGTFDFTFSIQASASNGSGDPHVIDYATIIVEEFRG